MKKEKVESRGKVKNFLIKFRWGFFILMIIFNTSFLSISEESGVGLEVLSVFLFLISLILFIIGLVLDIKRFKDEGNSWNLWKYLNHNSRRNLKKNRKVEKQLEAEARGEIFKEDFKRKFRNKGKKK